MTLDEAKQILNNSGYLMESEDTDYWFEELKSICEEKDGILYFYTDFIPVARKNGGVMRLYMPESLIQDDASILPALNIKWQWVNIEGWDEDKFVNYIRKLGNLHKLLHTYSHDIKEYSDTAKKLITMLQ